MPARLDLTPEQALERMERRREQTRLAVQRHRAKQKDAVSPTVSTTQEQVSLTPASLHARDDVRSTAFLVTPLPSVKEEVATDFEQVRCVLEPAPGYVHDEALLARLAASCPAVDLVLEAIGMADWLQRNRKRRCSKAFLANWVKRAATRTEPTGQPPPAPQRPTPRSALGRVLEQIATDPVAGPSTWH